MLFYNMLFSIIIPCRNESEIIIDTIEYLKKGLVDFDFEIIIVNDFSNDDTFQKVKNLQKNDSYIKILNNREKGLGGAINLGILKSSGNYIAIYMADMSDDIDDLKKYFNICLENKNIDAVFGSRFIRGSKIYNYPKNKLLFNRIFNNFVKILYLSKYNDFTNAFKIYKRETILELKPLVSENFNIFLELPLKIIGRKYNYIITSINWNNRTKGKAKFKINDTAIVAMINNEPVIILLVSRVCFILYFED